MASLDMDGINASAFTSFQASEIANASANRLQDTLQGTGSDSSDEELMSACKQFEAYFLEQIFKEMYKSVEAINGDQDSDPQKNLVSYFRDNTFSDIAKTSAETQSNGLAQMLFDSMKRSLNPVNPLNTTDS